MMPPELPPNPYIMELEHDAADFRMALSEIERIAAILIGRFFAACDGRHFEGRTCDYCLVSEILSTVRHALKS